jgi:hypothetical protein
MRKTSVITLLLLYIFTQLGTVAWYYYKPALHAICYNLLRFHSAGNNDANECIIKTDLTSFKNAKQDEHELLWKGDLYDINRIEINGNEIIITAKKDIPETSLMNIYHNIRLQISKNKLPHSPTDISFYQWMFKLYKPAETIHPFIAVRPFTMQNGLHSSGYIFTFFPDGPSQPPDFLS